MNRMVFLREIDEEDTHLIIVQENEDDAHAAFMAAMAILGQEGLEKPVAEVFSTALVIEDDNIVPDPVPACWILYETRNALDERCFVLRMTGEKQTPSVHLEIFNWLMPKLVDLGVTVVTCLSNAGNTPVLNTGDLYVYDWAVESRKGVIMTTNLGLIAENISIEGFSWSVPFFIKRICPMLNGLFTINVKSGKVIDPKGAKTLCRFLQDTHDLEYDLDIINEMAHVLKEQYGADDVFLSDVFKESWGEEDEYI